MFKYILGSLHGFVGVNSTLVFFKKVFMLYIMHKNFFFLKHQSAVYEIIQLNFIVFYLLF